jgi:hypothetical protein
VWCGELEINELVGVPDDGVHRIAVRHVLRGGAPDAPLRPRCLLLQPRPEAPPTAAPAGGAGRSELQRGHELVVVAGAPGEGSGGGVTVQKGVGVLERVDVSRLPGRLRRRRAGARAPRVHALLPRRLHGHVAAREHQLPHVPCRDHAHA